MNSNKVSVCNNKLSNEDIINLMSVYRDEWKYRDSTFMSSFFKFSGMSFFITFFPYLIDRIGMNPISPFLLKLHPICFLVFGIISALLGFLYSCAEAKRVEKVDLAYKNLMNQLPKDARIPMLKDEIGNSKNILKKISVFRLNSLLYFSYIIPIGLSILNIILELIV